MDTRVLSLRHLAGCVIAPLPEQIDATNAVRVQRDLIFLLTRGLGVLVADGSATTFCDVAGARALVRAAQASGGRPADFRLVAASPRLRRVLTLTGSDQILHLYPDLSSALPGKAEPAGNAGKPDRSGSRSLVTSALGRGGPSDRRRDRGARPPGAVPRLDTG